MEQKEKYFERNAFERLYELFQLTLRTLKIQKLRAWISI